MGSCLHNILLSCKYDFREQTIRKRMSYVSTFCYIYILHEAHQEWWHASCASRYHRLLIHSCKHRLQYLSLLFLILLTNENYEELYKGYLVICTACISLLLFKLSSLPCAIINREKKSVCFLCKKKKCLFKRSEIITHLRILKRRHDVEPLVAFT